MAKTRQQLISDLLQEDLFERLGWLIRLRWLAAGGLFFTILFTRYVLDFRPEMLPLFILNGALFASNVVYLTYWRRSRNAPAKWLEQFAVIQMVLDYVLLAVLLHYSGGVENPLIVTFVFQCIIASMLFSTRISYLLAALAIALVGGVVALEQANLWPHRHLAGFLPVELPSQWRFVFGELITLAIVLFVSVYLTTTIELASRKRRSEVAKRSAELEEARDQIRQADKMAALGQLAASMAHDINNPAGVICTRLEVMEAEGAFDNLPDRLRQDLATVRECAQYLRRVAEDWTGFTRKAKSHVERIDANEVVGRTVAMVTETLASHQIRLEVEACSFPLWVCGDPVHLQQVILNLVNNAQDAMPQGGRLTLRTTTGLDSDRQSCAIIEVADTGTGIAPQDLAHLFEPFFSRKPKGQGTGLGLTICQSIVKEMGGEIGVTSRLDEGTTFSVRLPVIAAPKRTETYARI